MRLCAGLAGGKFALLSWRSTTGRTTDSKYLFWSEPFFHNGKMMIEIDVQEWPILNSYEKTSALLWAGTGLSEFLLQRPISAFVGTMGIGTEYEDVPFAENLGCSTC